MPSHRDLPSSATAIQSALGFCRKEGLQFVLSDNSQDPAKEKEYAALQRDGFQYIKSPPCGLIENWQQTFEAADGEFILMMGDDDTLFGFAPQQDDLCKVQDDVVAIKPSLFAYAETKGVLKTDITPILSSTAQQRITENLKNSSGTNLGFFSFWRKSVIKSVMDLWMIHHPTKGAYGDWAVMHGLISSGKAVMHPSLCYFYNLQNWFGPPEKISTEVDRHYVNAGLSPGSGAYQLLFIGIDSFIFIGRKDSPVPDKEREQAATACLSFYLQGYLKNIPQTSSHPNAQDIAALSRKLIGNTTVEQIFNVISDILDAIRPGLGRQYRDYYAFAIGKPWGTF